MVPLRANWITPDRGLVDPMSTRPVYSRRSCVATAAEMAKEKRKFLGVMFECCKVYARLYINKEETAYSGRCPRCASPLEVKIGPGGTDNRFFTAS